MSWALAILFGVAVILFIVSFFKTDSMKIEQQIEQITSTFGDEVSQLQMQIRNLEIDSEIMAQEAGLLAGSSEKWSLLHDVLDLYKRGYSLDSIAAKKERSIEEIQDMLVPYIKAKEERRKVANDI
ncbi:hypothetical protein ACQKL5_15140 [Peribacillus sp. NPDC097675]|uniref:hypothetical protein n=1 Tax=Peribacillus sp. NPDC097675 TaxID=3390618 RepID=UPI003CFDB55B